MWLTFLQIFLCESFLTYNRNLLYSQRPQELFPCGKVLLENFYMTIKLKSY